MAAPAGTLPRHITRGPGGELVFSPSPGLRAFHLLLLVIVTWVIVLPVLLLVAFSSPVYVTLGMVIPLLAILLAIRWYIPKYWASYRVRFTGEEIISERGVWRKTRRTFPRSAVREIEIVCGWICRHLGIAGIRVMMDDGNEVRLPGVEEPEEMREYLIGILSCS